MGGKVILVYRLGAGMDRGVLALGIEYMGSWEGRNVGVEVKSLERNWKIGNRVSNVA
jgi:hypothetical protein